MSEYSEYTFFLTVHLSQGYLPEKAYLKKENSSKTYFYWMTMSIYKNIWLPITLRLILKLASWVE